jgi:putative transcriptional regulator
MARKKIEVNTMEEKTPIAELCKRYGLSQTALAKKFDIPLRTVLDWHGGRRKAPDYVVSMIDRLLSLEK